MATQRYYRISPRPMADSDLHDRHESSLWIDDGLDERPRSGLSVCEGYEQLLSYFAGGCGVSLGRGAVYQGAYIVELEGEPSGDEPWERELEALIHPARIVSQEPVAERFLADLCEHIEAMMLRDGQRARYDAERDEIVAEEPCSGACEGAGTYEDEGEEIECLDCDGAAWVAI
jgi:hypothetical protein